MREDNERQQQQLLAQSLMMSQEARVDAGLRHEITCLANENLVGVACCFICLTNEKPSCTRLT